MNSTPASVKRPESASTLRLEPSPSTSTRTCTPRRAASHSALARVIAASSV